MFGIGIYSTVTCAAPLLSGAARLHRLHRRPGRRASRHRSRLRNAYHRLPLKQGPTHAGCSPSASSPSASPPLYFGNVTLDISPTTLLLPILITGFGLSFIFVPISTAAYGTLDNKQIGNASGLFNLMRNVGGSIGISIASTLLTRRTDVHQNEIINSVPITGQQFQNSLQGRAAIRHQRLRPQQYPGPGAKYALRAARPSGLQLGLRRRLPLALAALFLLRHHRLVLQEGEARQAPSRSALTPAAEARHLDRAKRHVILTGRKSTSFRRSGGQFHRPSRSGETPVFSQWSEPANAAVTVKTPEFRCPSRGLKARLYNPSSDNPGCPSGRVPGAQ